MSDHLTDRLTAAFLGQCDHIDRALFGEARDEIERLREFRAHMKAVVEAAGFGSITEALVEIERLRAERDEAIRLRRAAEALSVRNDEEFDALQARLAEAVEVLLDVNDAAQIDVLMEGPRLQGWRRSELDRLWPKLRAFLAKAEEKP